VEKQGIDVQLGLDERGEVTHTYRVVEQRQARVLRRLFSSKGVFADFETLLGELDFDATNAFDTLYGVVGGKAYDVLAVFIPEIMPRWEFDGFASETAAEEDRYDEQADRSPSHPQVVQAFQTCIDVNGLRWVSRLGKLLPTEQIQALVAATLANQTSKLLSEGDSVTSPSQNGESESTISGTTLPTPGPPAISASPGDGSLTSSPPTGTDTG
jgi:hypothetical protein